MTELTPREILDAIRRGLEETARRFGGSKPDQAQQRAAPQPADNKMDQHAQRDTRS